MGTRKKAGQKRELVVGARGSTPTEGSTSPSLEEVVAALCEQIKEEVVQVIRTKYGDTLFRDQDGYLYRAITTRELALLPPLELLMLGQLEHFFHEELELYLFCVFGPNSGSVGSSVFRAVSDVFERRDREADEQAGRILRRFSRSN
jgi:hypothetical protein